MAVATPWAHALARFPLSNWDTQAGFNADVPLMKFHGMAHSALSGAGSGELGELRLLPFYDEPVGILFTKSLSASPGYFRGVVGTSSRNVTVESSVTKRAAIHRFHFDNSFLGKRGLSVVLHPPPDSYWGYELLDFQLDVKEKEQLLEGCSLSEISGMSGAESLLCFAISVDAPFTHSPSSASAQLVFPDHPQTVNVRIGLSRTSVSYARRNLQMELEQAGAKLQLEDVALAARQCWEKALSTVSVEIAPLSRRRVFYTGLYHSMMVPHLLSEHDGVYRLQRRPTNSSQMSKMKGEVFKLKDLDTKMPQAKTAGEDMYHTFSLWDTYRALHPMLNLIHPSMSAAFGSSLLEIGRQWGYLPIFQLLQSPAHMMEGDGGSIILATMAMQGLVEPSDAFTVLNRTRRLEVDERKFLDQAGFIEKDVLHSVSRALEQARADNCVGALASNMNLAKEAEYFHSRANLVFQHWDPQQRVFAPLTHSHEPVKLTGLARTDVTDGYMEGTALQYSFAATFNVTEMVRLHGGQSEFLQALDYFIYEAPEPHGVMDLSGNLHGLSLGNEPSMHVPYLYSTQGEVNRTARLVDKLVKTMFTSRPDGLPGNDDMGAMSTWAVLSLLGFYPVDPCSGYFVLGRPFVSSASLAVPGGKLQITVHNQGEEHMLVERVSWNGRMLNLSKPLLAVSELSRGGLLEFWMTA
ncbi:unnamed protein product [Symbiodinium natans]|uniref:Alpha-1,2-mannosidase n=1 Tax=Symbiodinium natans TaxID=878477 RepID=A0A812JZ96_9DINO|nr:unnamed protein product [Symbiodinium natans]